ncbi:hypothetical protein Tco_1456302 [Tanacetum coccineum]
MRTRNSNFPNNPNVTIPRRRNKGRVPNIVEPELCTIVAPMAERTMEELLRAPMEGYGEAIVLLEINADHFEIKTNLLQLVQANPFQEISQNFSNSNLWDDVKDAKIEMNKFIDDGGGGAKIGSKEKEMKERKFESEWFACMENRNGI